MNSVSKRVTAIYNDCRARREENDGAATIAAKDVAVLIRERLKVSFPDTKFSVRSDYNSVNGYWTDGPAQLLVERVTSAYKFGGFDGMIDLAYSGKNWLLPDGRMLDAACEGTEDSRGSVPSFATDCPEPGAILVKYGPKYVFAQREETPGFLLGLVRAAAVYYGFEFDASKPLWDQVNPQTGDYITTHARRLESDIAREQVEIGCAA